MTTKPQDFANNRRSYQVPLNVMAAKLIVVSVLEHILAFGVLALALGHAAPAFFLSRRLCPSSGPCRGLCGKKRGTRDVADVVFLLPILFVVILLVVVLIFLS